MVTRHRVNLSLSPIEYEKLSELAESQGKTPSTFVLDALKMILSVDSNMPPKSIKTPSEPFFRDTGGFHAEPPMAPPENSSLPFSQMNREQRRRFKKEKESFDKEQALRGRKGVR